MKKSLLFFAVSALVFCGCVVCAHAESTVSIPLMLGETGLSNTWLDSGDDPGSSTVDPVDPNQAKAELTGNTLKVFEGLEGDVRIYVGNLRMGQVVLQTSFDECVTLTLTDTAQYKIQLYHPSIGLVYGKFRYPVDNTFKIMQNGRLFILFNNQSYTTSGVKIR